VPGLPEWLLGLLNVRGTVQMVVDLGHLLGHGRSDAGDSSRLIFIEHGTAQLGLLVDREIGVRYLRPDDAPEHAMGGAFAMGCALLENHPVTVLDGAAIIRHVADALRAPAYLT
jgi:chemotaxis signal transduction protein